MKKIANILLLSILTSNLFAQFDNISIERFSANYGLPNGYIKDIFEDHYGFLWFGTREGLFRYDGYEFKAYRHNVKDSTTLSNPNINMVSEDLQGEIWIATNNGLNLLDRKTGKCQRFLPGARNETTSKITNLIRKVFEDSEGNIWLAATSKWNMLRFDKNSHQFIPTFEKDNIEAEHFVRTFFEDSNETVWAGTNFGLLKLNKDNSTFTHVLPDKNFDSDFNKTILGINEAGDGTFWLATSAGLIKWDPVSFNIEKNILPNEIDGIQINHITLDKRGNVWVAIEDNGLGVYDVKNKKFHHFKYQPNLTKSLNSNSVTCILEDRFRNIWIGTTSGISKIKMENSGFEIFLNEGSDGNISNNISRVMKDREGIIWSKTPEGVFVIEKGKTFGRKIKEISHINPGLGWDWFIEDYEGGIWYSISGDGFYRRSRNRQLFKKMPFGDSLSQEGIYKIVIDNKDPNIFWIGTTTGLCKLNWKTLERKWYLPMEDLPQISSNRFTVFDQYGEDEIWLYYTYSNSLGKFDKHTGKFELFLPDPANKAVLEGDIKDIAIGKDGIIWIANLYGLTYFNIHTKEFGIVGKNEGMQENELQSVFIDKKDQVWVVGNRFFARYDQLDNTFHNYLISKEILHFQSKVKHVAEDGTILLGSINGIYAFHPDNIKKNQQVPNVILTDFKVRSESYLLKQPYEDTENIILSHDENDIAFEFSGLHYINPEANEYKCKLVGYDAAWKELGNEHKVSYTNLNPGQYTFKAIASNSDGVWNEKGMTINLTITPAFWQTLWFESLIILIVLSIGYALIKNRQHQLALKRQKEMAEQNAEYKTMFLADVSHEIRTPMNAIIGLSKLALDTKLNAKQYKFIKAIRQSSQNLLSIINDLLDHTKLESGKFTFVKKAFELNEITEQLSDTLKFKAEENNLEFEINSASSIPRLIIGDPLRLTQILTNLLGNSLKFTEKGKVWLHVKKIQETDQDVQLMFEVGDTGKGIAESQLERIFESFQQANDHSDTQAEGTGLGLSIARQLVEKQGGQIFIESKLNKGTKLWFELTFGKEPNTETEAITEQQAQSLPDLKILVIEDNYFNQMVITEILEKYVPKENIEIAGNGKIGLEKCADQKFDIIVMDVKMPVLNGYETTKIIRNSEDPQLKEIPILAVTANALPNQLEKCLEVGMNDYVTKPVDENLLIDKINLLTKSANQIDRKRLKKLLVNDDNKVEKYLAIFKTQIPTQLQSLKEDVKKGDLELVSNTAHNIKSQCKFLGLKKIAEQAFEIEQSAENNVNAEQLPKKIELLEVELNAVIEKEF